MLAVESAGHAHVDAGEERQTRGVATVLGEAAEDHFLVARVVGDDEALEAPLAAQNLGLQPVIARRGDARQLIERGHDRQRARIDACFIGLQVDFTQRSLGNVDDIIIEA